jgi:hypothetical protein
MDDPYPGVPFENALRTLYSRFGANAVDYTPPNGNVFIQMPLEKGGIFHGGFRWQEAKYLAFNPQLRGEDLRNQKFPADWPEEPTTK